MDHSHKLKFVAQMTKMALEHLPHYDSGGVITAGNASTPLGGPAGALTVQNTYQAAAPTSAATVGQQQAGLAAQLQTEAAGGGPNPAQLQYLQNAQQIAQQQAAVNAQNRALNPGLAARQSSQAAVAAGQQAAGTAAAQQAQQQLAAQSQLGQLTGQEQTGAMQAAGINAQIAQNNVNAVQQTSAGLLGGVGQAFSALPVVGGLFSGLAHGGEVKQKYSDKAHKFIGKEMHQWGKGRLHSGSKHGPVVTDQKQAVAIALSQARDKGLKVPQAKMHSGGLIPHSRGADPKTTLGAYASGGTINTSDLGIPTFSNVNDLPVVGPRSGGQSGGFGNQGNFGAPQLTQPALGSSSGVGSVTQAGLSGPTQVSSAPGLGGAAMASQLGAAPDIVAGGGTSAGLASLAPAAAAFAKGGKAHKTGAPVRALVSPGEGYLKPDQVKPVADGKMNPMQVAERIPGKAKVKGDSEKNDVVPKVLADGGMVIPRSVMAHPMAPERAAAFVRAHLAKKRLS